MFQRNIVACLKPILTDVEALREILRKHKIGELSEQEADDRAKRVLAQPTSQGKRTDITCQTLTSGVSQSVRAESNGVSRYTQIKLDRLAKERPDLLEKISTGEMKVNTAAKLAGIVKPQSQLEIAQRAWTRMNEDERGEFLSWISNEA